MTESAKPTIIKKYANRRLYNTGTSTYVTLDDLAEMVKRGEEFEVQDAKSGKNITHGVLTQIIFELENSSGQTMLPVSFLRQLITFYGDQMQAVVPSYLEQTMNTFMGEQDRMRAQFSDLICKSPMDMMSVPKSVDGAVKLMEETTRRNMEMFTNAMSMMAPFADQTTDAQAASAAPESPQDKTTKPAPKDDALAEMRDQIAAMQKTIDGLEG